MARRAYIPTYEGMSDAERQYTENVVGQMTASGAQSPSKAGYATIAQQYRDEQNRNARYTEIDQAEQARNPYYAALYKQLSDAAAQQNQMSYQDNLKKSQLAMAGRGLTGSSIEGMDQARLGSQLLSAQAQANATAQGNVQSMRHADRGYADDLRATVSQSTPMQGAYYDSMLENMRAGTANQEALVGLTQDRNAVNQRYQNMVSQVYGNAINTGAQGISNYMGSK